MSQVRPTTRFATKRLAVRELRDDPPGLGARAAAPLAVDWAWGVVRALTPLTRRFESRENVRAGWFGIADAVVAPQPAKQAQDILAKLEGSDTEVVYPCEGRIQCVVQLSCTLACLHIEAQPTALPGLAHKMWTFLDSWTTGHMSRARISPTIDIDF